MKEHQAVPLADKRPTLSHRMRSTAARARCNVPSSMQAMPLSWGSNPGWPAGVRRLAVSDRGPVGLQGHWQGGAATRPSLECLDTTLRLIWEVGAAPGSGVVGQCDVPACRDLSANVFCGTSPPRRATPCSRRAGAGPVRVANSIRGVRHAAKLARGFRTKERGCSCSDPGGSRRGEVSSSKMHR